MQTEIVQAFLTKAHRQCYSYVCKGWESISYTKKSHLVCMQIALFFLF